jgi:hypothetical protein
MGRLSIMAHFTTLPEELLLMILDYVSLSDQAQETLWSLCLVSRYFLPVAEERLYVAPKSKWLTHNDIWTFPTRLFRTLFNNSRLKNKIRYLDLYVP